MPPQTQIDVMAIHEATVLSVAAAWKFLLNNGKSLAAELGVKPEDLILGEKPPSILSFHRTLTRLHWQ